MRYLLVLLISIFLLGTSFGQPTGRQLDKYSIEGWTTENGLPSNNLRQVIQDDKGFIWATSFNGLMRFDGNTFDIYNSDNLPELKSNAFTRISSDQSGNLYIGTLTSGLLKYDGVSFTILGGENNFANSISEVFVDSNETVWTCAKEKGLYTYNRASGKFSRVDNPLVDHITATCIQELDKNEIWFATLKNGIFEYNGKDFKKIESIIPADKQILCIRKYAGKVYVGTSNGIYQYEHNEWYLIRETEGYYINFLAFDKYGDLWVATETGLLKILQSGAIEILTEEDGLPSRQVSSLTFDNEDNIWLTTKRGGLAILRASNFINIAPKNGLSSPFINCVYQLNNGVITVGSDNGDVDLIKHSSISKMKIRTNLKNVSIKDILQDNQGYIWLATYKGLLKIKGTNEELLTTDAGIPSNNPRCLYKDKSGNVWVGAKDGGLLRIKPDGSLLTYSKETGLSDNYIFCINQLPNGNIITGTYQGGINIISTDGSVEVINVGKDNTSPKIFNILVINNDEYWLATDVGLYKYESGNFYKIDKKDGLKVKTIFDLYLDDFGSMWLTSNRGLVRLDVSSVNEFITNKSGSVHARVYDEKDGMLSRECTGATKMFIASSGNIWVPTSRGISVVNPDNVFVNNKVPPVYIKSVSVDGQAITGDISNIKMAPGSRRLTIDYTALSYYSPQKINFKYRLVGFDKAWNNVGNKYQATYMNLPEGNYTFEVIAANNDGLWNEVPATVIVQLDPYFYKSRVFFLLMGSFILFFIFLIYWIRIRVVEEKNKELHKLNVELDSFVYSVSHDLRAPLSSILGLINVSKLDSDNNNLPTYLDKIESSVNKLDEFIKEIISYSRNVRLQVDVEEVDLKELVEETIEGLAFMNPGNNINVSIKTGNNVKIHTDRTRLTIIFNNIISNAFRYYKKYINDPYIKIKIVVTNSKAVITIKDNGIGIKPDRLSKIFEMFYRATETSNGSGLGLYIARESAIKLEGTISVDSEFERGTTFTISIPNL